MAYVKQRFHLVCPREVKLPENIRLDYDHWYMYIGGTDKKRTKSGYEYELPLDYKKILKACKFNGIVLTMMGYKNTWREHIFKNGTLMKVLTTKFTEKWMKEKGEHEVTTSIPKE